MIYNILRKFKIKICLYNNIFTDNYNNKILYYHILIAVQDYIGTIKLHNIHILNSDCFSST